jgi:fucose permease
VTQARRAGIGLASVFALFGVLVGTWVSRIPTVKDTLGLDARTLGLALLGWPLGSLAASVTVPHFLRVFGSRPVVVFGSMASSTALVLLALATNAVELACAGFVFGLVTGVLDIAANLHGAAVEAATGGSVFSRLHACWSAGAFIGAGGGAVAAAVSAGTRAHFAGVAAATLVAGLAVFPLLLPADADAAPAARRRRSRPWTVEPIVLILGGIALAGFVAEAAVADWAPVYLHEHLGTTTALAAGGYATFAGVHLTVRFLGDALLVRLGRGAVLAQGCLVAATGYAVLLAVNNPVVAVAGLAIIGAGIAAVVPAAFGIAGRGSDSSSSVATVTGISYVGWAAAPPLIGVLAGHFGLRAALLVPLTVALVGGALGRMAARRVRLDADVLANAAAPTPR